MAAKRGKRGGRAKGGRPPWKPSVDQRITVERMKYAGESDNVIARAVGVDPDTLRKHCEDELLNGWAHRRKQVIDLLFESAEDGNVSSQRRLEEMGRQDPGDRQKPPEGEGESEEPPRRDFARGKKEQALADAQKAAEPGNRFAPPPPPRLIVNNDVS